ncbi:hypothetical protein KEJ32_03360 [Candidatus Bathyarchaeota archaeon]|nr:hypothetical protein [Candidatus Bathyarchaeota archaeon]
MVPAIIKVFQSENKRWLSSKLKCTPQQRLAYIPKEIFEALGPKLEVVPNLKGVFVYPEGLPLEQALASLEAIYTHLKALSNLKEVRK